MLTVSVEDYLWFVDQALEAMTAILRQLGDPLASRRPSLDGSNSPYAILTHCLGVMEFWGGATVAGRGIERDRDAEFRAEGPVADLIQRTAAARRQLATDLASMQASARPVGPLHPADAGAPIGRSQGGVLLHIYEELAQHLGQMELTRDVLLAG